MSEILQCRSVTSPKEGQWEAAQAVARRQVEDANTRPGTVVYQIYVDEEQRQLVNLAAYRDTTAWLTHIRSNPYSGEFMQLVDLVTLEVHGVPSEELEQAVAAFGRVTLRTPV